MYYSATALASPGGAHHCVSAATSDTILGPYIPLNNSLICPLAQGGAIGMSFPSTVSIVQATHMFLQTRPASRTGATRVTVGAEMPPHGMAGAGEAMTRTTHGLKRLGRKVETAENGISFTR